MRHMRSAALTGILAFQCPALGAGATGHNATATCCAALTKELGPKVVYPDSSEYQSSLGSYWSLEARVTPNCIVMPTTNKDVSRAVRTLVEISKHSKDPHQTPCLFAVRGGGHAAWAASNIDDGVTIDLSLIKEVKLSKDRSIASVGSGARWIDVYRALAPFGVAVVGARVTAAGVAGLTLGGGVSFFSPQYGFACDNVVNFEIVLGSGEIVNANSKERPDLFQVLKGGSNNFGIVTRFDLRAFEQGQMWGGIAGYPFETAPQHFEAFSRFTSRLEDDPFSSLVMLAGWNAAANQTTMGMAYHYAKPVVNPPSFNDFYAIQPEVVNTTRISNLTDFVTELDSPWLYGVSDIWTTITFANKPEIMAEVLKISEAARVPLTNVADFRWNNLFQPIPKYYSKLSQERGGNVLGIERAEGDSISYLLGIQWNDKSKDEAFYAAAQSVIDQIGRFAKSVPGGHRDFIYLNYATRTQNPIGSYGAENVRKMVDASRKYDPEQVFQKLVPGGFKLAQAQGYP